MTLATMELESSVLDMLQKIGIRKGQTILDFGCGYGMYTIPIAKIAGNQGKVYALDKDKEALDASMRKTESEGLKKIIITGVESHICVFQTCLSLIERGREVHVPQDAVDSRTDENWRVGLALMKQAGAYITSTESVIYQILKKAGTKEFKEMLKMVK